MGGGRYGNPEAVVLDFSPVTTYLAQQQQIRQAQQQQLDRQVNEDLTKLSFDGARTQDYSAIRSGYDTFKNAAIQYKKSLSDPRLRDRAEQDYLNSKANLNNLIAQSKEAKERTKGIYDFYAKNREQINDDEFKKGISLLNSPIGTQEYENSKGYDISSIIFKPEQFESAKWQPIINSVKPVEVSSAKELANGQILTQKKRVINPQAFAQTVEGLYNSDLGHGKKYWDDQFNTVPPEEKEVYEEYLDKYIPGFQIKEPKDLAVASYAYGRLEQDMGEDLKGVNRTRMENFQREMQRRIDDRLDKRIAALSKKDEEKNYYVVDDIAKSLANGNGQAAISPLLSEASSGVNVAYIADNDGINSSGRIDRIYADIKKNGVDAKTRQLSRKQLGEGTIIVAVPKIDPETKAVVPGAYDYMAVHKGEKFPQPRINALYNYAKGGEVKPLPQKYYKDKLTDRNTKILQNQTYGPAQLNDVEEEDEN